MRPSFPFRFRFRLLPVFSLLAGHLPFVGQVAGRLSGVAQDSSGRGIPNARVVLFLAGSDVEESATSSNDLGGFIFSALRPTFYDVTVEAPSLKPQLLKSLKIDPLADQNVITTVDTLFFGNAAFGRDLSQSSTPRRIQFALRYTF